MANTASMLQKKLVKWFSCILIALVLIAPFSSQSVLADEVFSDVVPSNSHYTGILEAYENGFLNGYPDGTFKPNIKLSRGNVTKSLGKLSLVKTGVRLEDYDFSKAIPFTDVPATHPDQELYKYSIIVKEAGIFTGNNNNLLPMNLMTRQHMSKVLVNAFKLKHIAGKQSKVIDNLLAGNEFRDYIDILSENNVTTVTNFRPGETTTRAQFATFLTNSNNASKGNVPAPPDPIPVPDPEPVPAPVVAMYVNDLLPITFLDILTSKPLPKTVPVVYSDGTSKEHAVTWNKNSGDLVIGTHHLSGIVKDTNFTVKLTVHVEKFVLFPSLPGLPGLPGSPGIPIIPVPSNAPTEYKQANSLIAALPLDVKNADNALAASQKWALTNNAVSIVKDKYPQYDLSAWNKVLTEQTKLIEKRNFDTVEARSAVTVALYDLYSQIKYVKDPAIAQANINSAKDKINAYKLLDKKAGTTTMMKDINKYQVIIDDLKIVLAAIDSKNMYLSIPNPTVSRPNYVLVSPQDPRVESIWYFPTENHYINSSTKQLIRDPSLFFPDHRRIIFIASVSKGAAYASREFDISLVPTISNFLSEGLKLWERDIIIYIEL